MDKRKLGLIVNPVAGMGGSVGLKGSDGDEILRKATELGAEPEAPNRAITALEKIHRIKNSIELITYPYEMGVNESIMCGFSPIAIGSIVQGNTTSNDTKNAAIEMMKLSVHLLLFAGGDGTARDICSVIGDKIPVLGIPAGVKMHSAIYGTSPQSAGELAAMYLENNSAKLHVHDAEVMDIDEEAFRDDRLIAKLYGYLKVPYQRRLVQTLKVGGISEEYSINSIARDVINNMDDEHLYIIGPGTTTAGIMKNLGLKYTLTGVDAIYQKRLVGLDLNEAQLLELIKNRKVRIIVTIIGGQGYIFGRGNQQISTEVIRRVGRDNIIIVAPWNKILSLRGNPLLVDTGDNKIDNMLSGYIKVITGLNEQTILKVIS